MRILANLLVCASMALCLAFLSVASRQMPRMDEQMAAEDEPALGSETEIALGQAKTACPPLWSKLPSPPFHATIEKSINVQLDEPP